jgi:hypothetical protein
MKRKEEKGSLPQASRRGFLTGLLAGAGATAAMSSASAQSMGKGGAAAPELFRRSAGTERVYKSVTQVST